MPTRTVAVLMLALTLPAAAQIIPIERRTNEVSDTISAKQIVIRERSSHEVRWTFTQDGTPLDLTGVDGVALNYYGSDWQQSVAAAIPTPTNGEVRISFTPATTATNGTYRYDLILADGSDIMLDAYGQLTLIARGGSSTNAFPAGTNFVDGITIVNGVFSGDGSGLTGIVGAGVSDGDKTDIEVTGTGTVWQIKSGVVGPAELDRAYVSNVVASAWIVQSNAVRTLYANVRAAAAALEDGDELHIQGYHDVTSWIGFGNNPASQLVVTGVTDVAIIGHSAVLYSSGNGNVLTIVNSTGVSMRGIEIRGDNDDTWGGLLPDAGYSGNLYAGLLFAGDTRDVLIQDCRFVDLRNHGIRSLAQWGSDAHNPTDVMIRDSYFLDIGTTNVVGALGGDGTAVADMGSRWNIAGNIFRDNHRDLEPYGGITATALQDIIISGNQFYTTHRHSFSTFAMQAPALAGSFVITGNIWRDHGVDITANDIILIGSGNHYHIADNVVVSNRQGSFVDVLPNPDTSRHIVIRDNSIDQLSTSSAAIRVLPTGTNAVTGVVQGNRIVSAHPSLAPITVPGAGWTVRDNVIETLPAGVWGIDVRDVGGLTPPPTHVVGNIVHATNATTSGVYIRSGVDDAVVAGNIISGPAVTNVHDLGTGTVIWETVGDATTIPGDLDAGGTVTAAGFSGPADAMSITYSPTGYTAAAATVLGHLQGISAAQAAAVGVTDGDKGHITVNFDGTNWTINSGVVTPTMLDRAYVTQASGSASNVTLYGTTTFGAGAELAGTDIMTLSVSNIQAQVIILDEFGRIIWGSDTNSWMGPVGSDDVLNIQEGYNYLRISTNGVYMGSNTYFEGSVDFNFDDWTVNAATITNLTSDLITLRESGAATGESYPLRFETHYASGAPAYGPSVEVRAYVADVDEPVQFYVATNGTAFSTGDPRLLTTEDEGSGFGLDADTIDGVQETSLARVVQSYTLSTNRTWTASELRNARVYVTATSTQTLAAVSGWLEECFFWADGTNVVLTIRPNASDGFRRNGVTGTDGVGIVSDGTPDAMAGFGYYSAAAVKATDDGSWTP